MLASRSFASACAMRVERCPALSLLSCGEGVCGGDVYDGNKVEVMMHDGNEDKEVMMHDGSEDKEVMMHDGSEDKEEVMMHDGSEDKEVMMHDGNEDMTAMNANDSKTATNDGNDDTATAKILTLKQLPSLRWFSAGEKAFSHVECAELKNLPSLSEKCIKLSESSFASLKRVVCETNCILQR
ncbi:hypothetical protein WA577_002055, partial [Blastocystis sp. JDR]